MRRATPGRGTVPGKILAYCLNSDGYPLVEIDGRSRRVHRLVAEAFLGLEPGELVHHKNEDRGDARLTNLEVHPSPRAHKERHRKYDRGLRCHGDDNPVIDCACGCTGTLSKYDDRGRPRQYIYGHNITVRVAA